jgi:ACR3 family arsenite efflux pump ArsB
LRDFSLAWKEREEPPRLVMCGYYNEESSIDRTIDKALKHLFQDHKQVTFIQVTSNNFDLVFRTAIIADLLKLKTNWTFGRN